MLSFETTTRCLVPVVFIVALTLLTFLHATVLTSAALCSPNATHLGTIHLDFNPAYLRLQDFADGAGLSLYVTSFFNAAIHPWPFFLFNQLFGPRATYFERDLVARIANIVSVVETSAYDTATVEELTDIHPLHGLFGPIEKTRWPNDAIKVPDGVFPFPALLIPQGFLAEPRVGRITAINMDDPNRKEYLVSQSNAVFPRFYHGVVFHDVNGDGLKDIITVRSNFNPLLFHFIPMGELVWFKNPGRNAILHGFLWQENVIYGGFPVGGPDIVIKAIDLDGDNVPELVTTAFFDKQILLFGAPCNDSGVLCTWKGVRKVSNPPRVKAISANQGRPFDIELVDLNKDGRVDILATNHQYGLDCNSNEVVAGRVYALEQPESGKIFDDEWTIHILMDGIRPNVTPKGKRNCRMAPGHAGAILAPNSGSNDDMPWIVVGGDEASKVWLLQPVRDWMYESTVVFDINEFYCADSTQTVLTDPAGITVSTVGKPETFQYESSGHLQLFIPVFEARDIQVYNISLC
jgi:hypothetical protein